MSRRIVLNCARCKKCGAVMVSRYRHDWVACPCGNYVDGGNSYLRRGGNLDDLEELSQFEDTSATPESKP